MEGVIHTAAGLVVRAKKAYERKWVFLGVFVLAFFVSFLVLARLNLLPGAAASSSDLGMSTSPLVAGAAVADTTPSQAEFPVKIAIPKIKLTASVANPATTDIGVLDAALLSGAVRYPTSAELNESGNIVVFGHSSYLPIVNNPAYKTFDGIQKLVPKDVIMVYSSTRVYTYAVNKVVKMNAGDAAIPLSIAGRVLTLSTCDSFGTKSDRFVVTADFVESHSNPI